MQINDHSLSTKSMRATLRILALVLVIAMLGACTTQSSQSGKGAKGDSRTSAVRKKDPIVHVMMFVGPASEGSFTECLQRNYLETKSAEQALEACDAANMKSILGGAKKNSLSFLPGSVSQPGKSADVGPDTSACNPGVDPTRAASPTSPQHTAPTREEYVAEVKKKVQDTHAKLRNTKEWEAYDAAAEKEMAVHNDPFASDSERAAAKTELQDATKALHETPQGREYLEALDELHKVEKVDDLQKVPFWKFKIEPKPAPQRPLVSRPDPDASSVCEAMAHRVWKCNQHLVTGGHAPSECKTLVKQKRCRDEIMLSDGPLPFCKGSTFETPVDLGVAIIRCQERIHPVPGEDPCLAMSLPGATASGIRLPIKAEPNCGDGPCSTPLGCPGGECPSPGCPLDTCSQEIVVTLVRFTQASLDTVINHEGARNGGLIFVLPQFDGSHVN
jgi:hypothetical protein